MAHISQKKWLEVSNMVSTFSLETLNLLARAKEYMDQLTIMYTVAGGTDQALANQLFADEIAARGETVANADEVQMTIDLKDAAVSIYELWQSMNNVATSQKDRANALRRMV